LSSSSCRTWFTAHCGDSSSKGYSIIMASALPVLSDRVGMIYLKTELSDFPSFLVQYSRKST
ncbi:MAG: hypothetical protein ACYTXY_55585, partial [Nostoc sp.]